MSDNPRYETVPMTDQFPPDYCTMCGSVVADKEAHNAWHRWFQTLNLGIRP